MTLRRRIHTDADLADLAESLGIPADELERDFLLVTIAAQLHGDFPGAFCFKGGFVLRHVHGQRRLSVDIDATRHSPPRHKLETDDVRRSITRAGGNLFRVRVADPETDSAQSLDFDRVSYTGPLGRGIVAVEVSYRESLVLDPIPAQIGEPFFDPFFVPVMAPDEIVAEKLRTLAQRRRPTDLSDLAFLLANVEIDHATVRRVAESKFKPGLVQQGDHRSRITANVEAMQSDYEASVHAVAPDAPPYSEAAAAVLAHLKRLLD
jgi:predicted nucleotidyltransferase component of viral defense system